LQGLVFAAGKRDLLQGRLLVPRRAEISVRPLDPDPVYNSVLVTQVINKVMSRGKKSVAEKIVYDALEQIGTKTGKPPVEVLEQAVKTVTPVLEVRSRRVGGANYQVPVEVPQRRARTLAVRWLVTYARERREKHMDEKLAGEILDALNQQGGAFKRKDDVYRMAQANKAFAHYRW
jgi:small subunit ribosomal protein S7